MNGRLLPIGWLKFLLAPRKIDRVRVFALGVKREYQHTGVAARFYEMHFDSAEATPQKVGETGWILETNKPMNRAMEGMGGESSAATASSSACSRTSGPEEAVEFEAVPVGAPA